MKLQNLIIAISAFAIFASCSDSVEPNPEGTIASLKAKVVTRASTTNDELELEGEANINNISIIAFNEAGTEVLGVKSETLTSVSHEYNITLGIAQLMKVKFVLIANAPIDALQAVTNYTELEALLAKLSDQKQDYLTMSTPVITTASAIVEGGNYIGTGDAYTNINGIKTLYLTRVPARVQVGSIKTNFTKPILVGRDVQIRQIHFENVKTQSRFFSVADWGKVEVNDNFMDTDDVSFVDNNNNANNIWVNNTDHATNLLYKYVMENLGTEGKPTIIWVQARLAARPPYFSETKWFSAVINPNGLEKKTADHNYVKRNYVYDLGLTFGDGSFDGDHKDEDPEPPVPDTTNLHLEVTVIPYGPAVQDIPF